MGNDLQLFNTIFSLETFAVINLLLTMHIVFRMRGA